MISGDMNERLKKMGFLSIEDYRKCMRAVTDMLVNDYKLSIAGCVEVAMNLGLMMYVAAGLSGREYGALLISMGKSMEAEAGQGYTVINEPEKSTTN